MFDDPVMRGEVFEAIESLKIIAVEMVAKGRRSDIVEIRECGFNRLIPATGTMGVTWVDNMDHINGLLASGWVFLALASNVEEGAYGVVLGRPRSVKETIQEET